MEHFFIYTATVYVKLTVACTFQTHSGRFLYRIIGTYQIKNRFL